MDKITYVTIQKSGQVVGDILSQKTSSITFSIIDLIADDLHIEYGARGLICNSHPYEQITLPEMIELFPKLNKILTYILSKKNTKYFESLLQRFAIKSEKRYEEHGIFYDHIKYMTDNYNTYDENELISDVILIIQKILQGIKIEGSIVEFSGN